MLKSFWGSIKGFISSGAGFGPVRFCKIKLIGVLMFEGLGCRVGFVHNLYLLGSSSCDSLRITQNPKP